MNGWETEIRGNTQRNYKKLYDVYGNHVGTISITKSRKASGKKKKSALYSFKQISSQVLQAKTSTKAMEVSNSIRAKIGLLRKQLKNGDYDEEEILRAILHAEMVQRACEKKEKNLKMEETAQRNIEGKEEIPVEPQESIEEAVSDEEIEELEREEFEALMEKLELSAEDMMEMAEETVDLDEDLLQADLKYLKALFDRLQSEKENGGNVSMSGNYDSGVSLSLGGGMDMPIMTQEVQQPDIGGMMDIEIKYYIFFIIMINTR